VAVFVRLCTTYFRKGGIMTRGGVRIPGPGKRLGRPRLDLANKRRKKNITLTVKHMRFLHGKNVSNEIEKALDNYINNDSDLLYAVESKFPGETRHETALRYIKEAEKGGGCYDREK